MTSRSAPIDLARKPLEAFLDRRVETFARCRAQGVSVLKSSEEAGIGRTTGQALEKEPDVIARIQEMRDASRDFTSISLGAIMQRLWNNSESAALSGDFKASNQALGQLVDLVKMDAGKVAGGLRLAGSSPKDKRAALRESLGAPDAEPSEPDMPVLEADATSE